MGELDQRERDFLDFAGLTWRLAGTREQAIRERFDMSAARYHQAVLALIRRPEALAYAPMTVRRLTRLRDQARRDRSKPGPVRAG